MIAWAILLCGEGTAADQREGLVCFDQKTAGRMVVEIERGRIAEGQLALAEEAARILEERIELLGGMVRAREAQFREAARVIERQEALLGEARSVIDEGEEAAFWEKFLVGIGAGSAGVVIGILVGILL